MSCRLLYTVGLAAGMGVGVAGCGREPTAVPARYDLAVASDKAQYSLAADSVARVTLTNRSDRSVYLPMDSYVLYERLVDGRWQGAYAWFVVDGVGRSFPVAAGAAQTDQLELRFYLPGRPGTYRFRYLAYADPDVRSLLPLEERVSPPFTLTP